MKKLLSIIILGLLFTTSANAKEINLSCELSKYIEKKGVLSDEQQIPLSKVNASDLKKFTLSFDMENEKQQKRVCGVLYKRDVDMSTHNIKQCKENV